MSGAETRKPLGRIAGAGACRGSTRERTGAARVLGSWRLYRTTVSIPRPTRRRNMRLFIALNLPQAERERIHEAAAPLREAGYPVRWLDPDRFHLTLKFLGEVRSERVPTVERVVERVAASTGSFEMEVAGFGAFPTIRRPRVLWVGVTPDPALRCLKQDLEWALANHGFERETRAFHPHITLGRVDVPNGAGAFRGLDEEAAGLDYRSRVPVRTVELMRSHLSRKGARYSVVRECELKVAASKS